MNHITIIAGARPNFMKVAPIIHEIKKRKAEGVNIDYSLVHTGQHYDTNMSALFFDELQIPQPAFNLQIGSGTHAVQTAKMLIGIEELLLSEKVDALLVYGDTNSTIV